MTNWFRKTLDHRIIGALLTMAICFGGIAQAQPAEPWQQCPAVGADTSCGILIVINADSTVSVYTSSTQGAYDTFDDTLIGVQNNSSQAIPALSISSSTNAFGFSGDGICDTSGNVSGPHPAGCPFGPTGYEGPAVSFTVPGGLSACTFGPWQCATNSSASSGTVNFNPPIPAGKTAYFGLQQKLTGNQISVTPPSPTPPPTPQNLTTSNNPPQGCTPPPSFGTFAPTAATVYVFFILNGVHSSDQVADVWLAPSGHTYTSDSWASASGNVCYTDQLSVANNPPSTMPGIWTFQVLVNQTVLTSIHFTITNPPPPLGFFPITPCRAVDTRQPPVGNKTGPFGPPSMAAYTGREFPLEQSGCGLPSTAQAYSLNFTVVPPGPLDFLSAWPSNQPFPGVSTLNSPDGSIIANAAIVPDDPSGNIEVTGGESTDLIIDANGYFAPPNGADLAFYPMTPCRVVDTRDANKPAGFGPPSLGTSGRVFSMYSSACNIPNTARAYALNLTVVPKGPLSFLSIWPADKAFPNVSTLNSNDGSILANAAIVPAAANGSVEVTAGNPTDFIMDINGYFAAPGNPGALHFYPVVPCRVADTRSQGLGAAFGPPSLTPYQGRVFPILQSGCGIPSAAKAYSLNITVVPQGPLSFLSAWPSDKAFPNVSTLNSPKGLAIANAAIVPAAADGSIEVTAGNPTDVVIDINGYFAP